jgi:hypothetical protein
MITFALSGKTVRYEESSTIPAWANPEIDGDGPAVSDVCL